MKHTINDTFYPSQAPDIRITTHLLEGIQQTDKLHWNSLFNQFRLNLASRIVGSDDRELLKLQAKIEYVGELEQFFKGLFSK